MRVLITGSAGFIGSHMMNRYKDAGHDVIGIDKSTDVRAFSRANQSHYDLVIHCAAVVGGRKVMDWSPIDHAQNLEIDAALFAWAKKTEPGRVVYFSSSCAYPVSLAAFREYIREDDIGWPPSPRMMPDKLYGWTKLTGELLAKTARDDGIPVSIVRPFSVYGPGMAEGFAVRGFAKQIAVRADPVEIWGNSNQIRDYIHVSDVCNAVMTMADEEIDGPVNLGTGCATSLSSLALTMAGIAGYRPQLKTNLDLPAGVLRLVADPGRLRSFYEPAVELENGLRSMTDA